MPKWVKIGLCVFLLGLVGGIAWLLWHTREPAYHGRPLSQWLDRFNQGVNKGWPHKMEGTTEAIRAMGTNSLPFLLDYIGHQEPWITRVGIDLLRRQHRVKLPFYGENPYREPSLMALHILGSEAAPLFPELLKLAENPLTSYEGTRALLAIGTTAIPALERVCRSTNFNVRVLALWQIASLRAVPRDHVWWDWKIAPANGRGIFVFGSGPDPYGLRNEMLALLKSPAPAVRRASGDALATFTRPAARGEPAQVLSALREALNDTNSDVRCSAARALKQIDPTSSADVGKGVGENY